MFSGLSVSGTRKHLLHLAGYAETNCGSCKVVGSGGVTQRGPDKLWQYEAMVLHKGGQTNEGSRKRGCYTKGPDK